MNHAELNNAAIHLRKGEVYRIRKGRGQRIETLNGSLWVTMDHDLRDILVATGEGFTLETERETLVSALADSRFLLLPH
jgi:Protein of unknown function (DUF2917)